MFPSRNETLDDDERESESEKVARLYLGGIIEIGKVTNENGCQPESDTNDKTQR